MLLRIIPIGVLLSVLAASVHCSASDYPSMIAVKTDVFDFIGYIAVDKIPEGSKKVKRLCDFDVCGATQRSASGCADYGREGSGQAGLVQEFLVNGVPAQKALGYTVRNVGKWYTENEYNVKVQKYFNLQQLSFKNAKGEAVIPNYPVYSYSVPNGYFFPLTTAEGAGYPSTDGDYTDSTKYNHLFATAYRNNFTYHKLLDSKTGSAIDMTLTFYTDDDSWVFIDGRMAADNGGLKSPTAFTVQLDKVVDRNGKLLEEGKVYEIAIFQADRCPSAASMTLIATILDASMCVDGNGNKLDRDGDGVVDCLDACPDDPNKKVPGSCGCSQPTTCTETVCDSFTNQAYCQNSTGTACEWCGSGQAGGSCLAKGGCTCSMISDMSKCTSATYLAKCDWCGLTNKCAIKNTCPCDAIGAAKTQCVGSTCSWCGLNCTSYGKCPECTAIADQANCQGSINNCEWCGNLASGNKCDKSGACPGCNSLSQTNCPLSSKNCTFCDSANLCLSEACTECSKANNYEECQTAGANSCKWCGLTCIKKADNCPGCTGSSADVCEKLTDGTKSNPLCSWCGNGQCNSLGQCPSCDSFNDIYVGVNRTDNTAVYDAETKIRNACLGSVRGCTFCGRGLGQDKICVADSSSCPTCNSYTADVFKCIKLENSTTSSPNNNVCEYCDYTQLCMSKIEGVSAAKLCDIECHLYTTYTGCQQSNLSCHWCSGVNASEFNCKRSNETCPNCPTFQTESTCVAASCNWCQPASGGAYECMGSKCPIPTIAIAAAAIAASVIAAIIVAIIVFLLLSSFASKKLYDAIKSAKESEMSSATESGLYQEKDNGGENPAFK